MADELVVVLGGSVAATLTRLENARLRLEYDEAYRETAPRLSPHDDHRRHGA